MQWIYLVWLSRDKNNRKWVINGGLFSIQWIRNREHFICCLSIFFRLSFVSSVFVCCWITSVFFCFVHSIFFGVDFKQRPPKNTRASLIKYCLVKFGFYGIECVCECVSSVVVGIYLLSFCLASHQGHFPCAQYMFRTSWWGHLSFICI